MKPSNLPYDDSEKVLNLSKDQPWTIRVKGPSKNNLSSLNAGRVFLFSGSPEGNEYRTHTDFKEEFFHGKTASPVYIRVCNGRTSG
ncbi:hypothetical protein SAMN05443094_11232 [Domibacillus enclensis]|uniref:Uncharacterized protein n=1 Tax=Domibacillus enclensis TaxID=1017273 RepID=A0A1N7C9D1_9BACI|nr:hypothetical protein SAMN05443094_11232 [Domibacillus enclensis]